MYCSNCGTQNPDGAAFCTNCGVGFATQQASASVEVVDTIETQQMRKKATTAMVLGIIACVVAWYPVLSIAGIILGAIALSKVKQVKAYCESVSMQRPGTALAAKITGLVGLIGGIVMTVFYVLYIILIVFVVVNVSGAPFYFEDLHIDIPTAF